jgi:hypothetical protein
MGALPEIGSPKLSDFEVWDRTIQARAGTERKEAFVSVLVSGFRLNLAARRMLGEPGAVRIMFDPEQRRVGFVPVGPESANCYPISLYSSGGLQISCKKLMEHYGISVERTTRCYDLEMVAGVLVANLGGVLG